MRIVNALYLLPKFLRNANRFGVDLNGVFHAPGIAPCQRDGDGNILGARFLKYQLVALLQTFNRELEPAELIVAIGVGARHVVNQIRLKFTERLVEPFFQLSRYSASSTPSRRLISSVLGGLG